MPRTIVYATHTPRPQAAADGQPTFGGPSTESATKPSGSKSVAIPDGYAEKLTKYVPAEVVAFFTPIAAVVGERPALLIAATVVGLLATPGYLWNTTKGLDPEQKPQPHYYFLAGISFLAWALGTSKLGSLIGMDHVTTSLILGAAIFLLPLADALLEKTVPVHRPQAA